MNMTRFVVRGIIIAIVCGALYGFLRVPELVTTIFPTKSINILVWPNVIDASYFDQFEKDTGITVNLSYFENHEELLVKMQSGMGDYDLVMASDYAMPYLIQAGIVKQIDKAKLPFWQKLYPSLLGLYFDPENKYTIPYSWEIYGIGIDTTYYKDKIPKASWDLLFNDHVSPGAIGMLDDAREVVSIVALYLFGKGVRRLTSEHMQQIGQLLRTQKKRVVMYTDLRTDYLLVSQSAPVVLGMSSDIYHAMRNYDSIQFLLPKEGSFLLLDMWLIPKATQKDNWVYQFLSYIYKPDVMKKYADRYNFFPSIEGIVSDQDRYLLVPTEELFGHVQLFDYVIPERELRDLWISLKS